MDITEETGLYVSNEVIDKFDKMFNDFMDELPETITRQEYLVLKDFVESTISYKLNFHLLECWEEEDMSKCLGKEG